MTFNFDVSKVVSDMLNASSGALVKGGQQAVEYATHEYKSFIVELSTCRLWLQSQRISH